MGGTGRRLWPATSAVFLAASAAYAWYHRSHSDGASLDITVYIILVLAGGWAGALAGGLAEWLRYGRSPLEPLFEGRFGWYYRQRFWLRFAAVFSLAWVFFVLMCILLAAAVGAYEEALTFLTAEGAAAVILFVVVFGVEGAIVGGAIDLARLLFKK